MVDQAVVGAQSIGIGGDADGGSGGGTGGGEVGDGWDGDGDGWLIRWEDNIKNVILGMEHNPPI